MSKKGAIADVMAELAAAHNAERLQPGEFDKYMFADAHGYDPKEAETILKNAARAGKLVARPKVLRPDGKRVTAYREAK